MKADSASDRVYRLKLTLLGVKPPIWRRIESRGETTFAELHRIIQAVMGWTDSHLHEFRSDRPGLTEATRLSHAFDAVGDRFRYVYDFGDEWIHEIVIEAIGEPSGDLPYPRFVGGRRACPPEDVGGPPGYERFLTANADPSDPEHDDMLTWAGGPFDPKNLDADGIESRLSDLRGALFLNRVERNAIPTRGVDVVSEIRRHRRR